MDVTTLLIHEAPIFTYLHQRGIPFASTCNKSQQTSCNRKTLEIM